MSEVSEQSITFADQAALDDYVRRVLARFLDDCEASTVKAIDDTAAARKTHPKLIAILRGGAMVTARVNRAALALPLPKVTR